MTEITISGQLEVWVRDWSGMEVFVLVVLALSCTLIGCLLYLSLSHSKRLNALIEGTAFAFEDVRGRLEFMEGLPELLEKVGGVTLQPQKSFGEILLDKAVDHFSSRKERLNVLTDSEEPWPQGKEENQPLENEENPLST